jgi:MFS family permease
MVAWGIVMTLMGIVQNYHGLLVARLFLGVTEAGLYPGVSYYLTMWYCTHEVQWVSPNPPKTRNHLFQY